MDIISLIANLTKAATNAGNQEMFMQLQAITGMDNELLNENNRLKEEIEQLKTKTKIDNVKEFKNQAYYFDQEGPFCSRCYDDENKMIRMLERDNGCGTINNVCPKCKNKVFSRKSDKITVY